VRLGNDTTLVNKDYTTFFGRDFYLAGAGIRYTNRFAVLGRIIQYTYATT